jgi:hypothetical protein
MIQFEGEGNGRMGAKIHADFRSWAHYYDETGWNGDLLVRPQVENYSQVELKAAMNVETDHLLAVTLKGGE